MTVPNTINESELSPYEIKAGDHYSRPTTQGFRKRAKDVHTIEALIKIPDLENKNLFDYEGDPDMYDWSKVLGLHFTSSMFFGYFNPKDNLLLAFRQISFEDKLWQIAPYLNYNWSHDDGTPFTFKSGDLAHAYFKKRNSNGKEWDCFVGSPGQEHNHTYFETRIKGYGRRDFVRNMKGLYHGGANNAPGPYGGKAPIDMEIWMAYKINGIRYY